jgi:hypothetical protein
MSAVLTCQPPVRLAERVAPMRIIRQLLSRRAGGLEETIIARQLSRQEQEILTAKRDALRIEASLTRSREMAHAALNDSVTPGVITADEAAEITKELIAGSQIARAHTSRLEALLS